MLRLRQKGVILHPYREELLQKFRPIIPVAVPIGIPTCTCLVNGGSCSVTDGASDTCSSEDCRFELYEKLTYELGSHWIQYVRRTISIPRVHCQFATVIGHPRSGWEERQQRDHL